MHDDVTQCHFSYLIQAQKRNVEPRGSRTFIQNDHVNAVGLAQLDCPDLVSCLCNEHASNRNRAHLAEPLDLVGEFRDGSLFDGASPPFAFSYNERARKVA
jgi:hypothetical protein